FRTRTFQDGWIEVQDEGSQLVGLAVEAKRHECVVDFCAGAGGKTLHLGALMHNTGMLYAFDTAAFRLDRARERARRAGLSNVRQQVLTSEQDVRLQRLHGKADRVLVDAPCSGSGTWRRNPDMKWRMDAATIQRLAQDQQRILRAAAALVKPGGRLVYATCSLLPQENEQTVADFLAHTPGFRIEPVSGLLARRDIILDSPDGFLRLRPDRHGTDGFFVAALTRSS
ncbi:MAG TPA: RsmB/NOP family class I SAM-dependent RNA methyltransferase, partial [Acidiferrobacteraceae bacterium]|nr:RsmB/NOP family class I SAM-dependent RNA methyltransferase [Acidiferrobacteraceae bacterium]